MKRQLPEIAAPAAARQWLLCLHKLTWPYLFPKCLSMLIKHISQSWGIHLLTVSKGVLISSRLLWSWLVLVEAPLAAGAAGSFCWAMWAECLVHKPRDCPRTAPWAVHWTEVRKQRSSSDTATLVLVTSNRQNLAVIVWVYSNVGSPDNSVVFTV